MGEGAEVEGGGRGRSGGGLREGAEAGDGRGRSGGVGGEGRGRSGVMGEGQKRRVGG